MNVSSTAHIAVIGQSARSGRPAVVVACSFVAQKHYDGLKAQYVRLTKRASVNGEETGVDILLT